MFEAKFEELLRYRKEINTCDDFNKITTLWAKIKENYSECTKYIENLNQEISNLVQTEIEDNKLEMISNFEESFKELKKTCENIKTCKFDDLSKNIQRIKLLKTTCLSILNQEKCKIQEVK